MDLILYIKISEFWAGESIQNMQKPILATYN